MNMGAQGVSNKMAGGRLARRSTSVSLVDGRALHSPARRRLGADGTSAGRKSETRP